MSNSNWWEEADHSQSKALTNGQLHEHNKMKNWRAGTKRKQDLETIERKYGKLLKWAELACKDKYEAQALEEIKHGMV